MSELPIWSQPPIKTWVCFGVYGMVGGCGERRVARVQVLMWRRVWMGVWCSADGSTWRYFQSTALGPLEGFGL